MAGAGSGCLNGKLYDDLKQGLRTSLVAQRLRIRLPVQGTRVRALVPHAAEQLSPCATTTEPMCHNY